MSKPEPEEVANYLNSLTPIERERFVASMRADTNFCWECFYDDGGKPCHCMNDE